MKLLASAYSAVSRVAECLMDNFSIVACVAVAGIVVFGAAADPVSAADFSNTATDIETEATNILDTAYPIIGGLVALGLGIFGIKWLAGQAKGGVSSGS